ncbi:hypothetical protein BH18THE2_BH18THE2_07430 [soil metagenome]
MSNLPHLPQFLNNYFLNHQPSSYLFKLFWTSAGGAEILLFAEVMSPKIATTNSFAILS